MSTPPKPPGLDPETERSVAVGLFNRAWELLETTDRTTDQDDDLIHTAHASRYHWGRVGEPFNRARGEVAMREVSTLGRAEPALWHSGRCLAILEASGSVTTQVAAAYEGLAAPRRGGRRRGRVSLAGEEPKAALAAIADPEDRQLIEQDLATVV
jgi:hypothetical protein